MLDPQPFLDAANAAVSESIEVYAEARCRDDDSPLGRSGLLCATSSNLVFVEEQLLSPGAVQRWPRAQVRQATIEPGILDATLSLETTDGPLVFERLDTDAARQLVEQLGLPQAASTDEPQHVPRDEPSVPPVEASDYQDGDPMPAEAREEIPTEHDSIADEDEGDECSPDYVDDEYADEDEADEYSPDERRARRPGRRRSSHRRPSQRPARVSEPLASAPPEPATKRSTKPLVLFFALIGIVLSIVKMVAKSDSDVPALESQPPVIERPELLDLPLPVALEGADASTDATTSSRLLRAMTKQAARSGDLDQALRMARSAVRVDPSGAENYQVLAAIYRALGRLEEMGDTYAECRRDAPRGAAKHCSPPDGAPPAPAW